MIPILFFLFSLTQPTPGYICDLPSPSAPFHPISPLAIKISPYKNTLEVSFFFFLGKKHPTSTPNHCSSFCKSHLTHVLHIACLRRTNKQHNQHMGPSELPSLPKRIPTELSFLSCIQICSCSVVLPLTQ